MLHVIWHVITGFVVGLFARALLPGGDQMGLIATTIVGVVGSVVGGDPGRLIKKPEPELVPPGRVHHVPRRRDRRTAGVAHGPLGRERRR